MRLDENRFLVTRIYRQFNTLFPEGAYYNEIIDSFKNSSIKLSITDSDLISTNNQDAFDEIVKALPYLRKICNAPRSFIKSIEEKVQIDQVKRINKKAISKLSNNSNDWYARSFTMVKPKTVIADINEETIDIYENRFVRTLIDKVNNHLIAREAYLNRLLSEKRDMDIEHALMIEFKKTNNTDSLIHKLNSEKYNRSLSNNDLYEALNKVHEVQKTISVLKQSELYRLLKRKNKVKSPISVTNILMFENNYKQAYKLWRELEKVVESETINYEQDEGMHLEDLYRSYCIFNLLAALYDLGFNHANKARFVMEQYSLHIIETENGLVLSKKFWGKNIECSVYSNYEKSIYLEFKCENNNRKFTFDFSYSNFEESSTVQVGERLTSLLMDLNKYDRITKNFEKTASNYQLVSLDINYYQKERELDDFTVHKLYSIGDFFQNQDAKWNDYKRGIGIISPYDIQSNITRLKRMMNYHFYKVIGVGLNLFTCPICGNNELRKTNETDYTCNRCSHMISNTYHDKCDPKHKKPILWIKYVNNKYLTKSVVIDSVADENFAKRARRTEIIMGEYAITSSYLVMENFELKLKTVCPHCGEILGQ